MIFYIILLILTAIGVVMILTIDSYNDWHVVGAAMIIVFGSFAVLMTISIPISQRDTLRGIADFESVRKTVEDSRRDGISDLERATITKAIIDANSWLAKEKFDNTNMWDWWTHDSIDSVKPIE